MIHTSFCTLTFTIILKDFILSVDVAGYVQAGAFGEAPGLSRAEVMGSVAAGTSVRSPGKAVDALNC